MTRVIPSALKRKWQCERYTEQNSSLKSGRSKYDRLNADSITILIRDKLQNFILISKQYYFLIRLEFCSYISYIIYVLFSNEVPTLDMKFWCYVLGNDLLDSFTHPCNLVACISMPWWRFHPSESLAVLIAFSHYPLSCMPRHYKRLTEQYIDEPFTDGKTKKRVLLSMKGWVAVYKQESLRWPELKGTVKWREISECEIQVLLI